MKKVYLNWLTDPEDQVGTQLLAYEVELKDCIICF